MYKRYKAREVAIALDDTPVIMITGARQTGKSTFCKQLVDDGVFSGNSITLDDPSILTAAQSDPLGFLNGLGNSAIIDEVQRAPELFLSLKKLVDEDRSRRYIMTGSADVMLMPRVADSLAGRVETHNLWPLSMDEIAGKESSFLSNLILDKGKFKNYNITWEEIIHLLSRGGYPEVVNRKTENRRIKWLQAYLESILQKDIRDLANIDGLLQIPKVLNLLSVRVGSTVNMSDVARLSGIKNTSFQRYMALLEQVFLIVKIQAWTPNNEGQYVKSPKLYLNDTGLLCSLCADGQNLLEDKTQAGHILENFVAMELKKQVSWFEKDLKLHHFSMHKGAEVDLVIEDQKKNIYGIEIKSKFSLNKDDFKGLKKLEELAGKKFKKGIVLYSGEQVISGFGGRDFQAVPLPNLWMD